MPTYRKIRRAEYEQDKQTHHKTTDVRTGRVTVFYSNGRRQEFDHIRYTEFADWERRHWDYTRPPNGIKTLQPEFEPEIEDIDAELAEQEQAYVDQRERRRKLFRIANLELEKRIGTEQYRIKYGTPASELEAWDKAQEERQKQGKKLASRFSPDNPRWRQLNMAVRDKIGHAEYDRLYGQSRQVKVTQ
jgi:hypothetical protein